MCAAADTDFHAFAGRLLNFLTNQPELKTLNPLRMKRAAGADQTLRWEEIDYARSKAL